MKARRTIKPGAEIRRCVLDLPSHLFSCHIIFDRRRRLRVWSHRGGGDAGRKATGNITSHLFNCRCTFTLLFLFLLSSFWLWMDWILLQLKAETLLPFFTLKPVYKPDLATEEDYSSQFIWLPIACSWITPCYIVVYLGSVTVFVQMYVRGEQI